MISSMLRTSIYKLGFNPTFSTLTVHVFAQVIKRIIPFYSLLMYVYVVSTRCYCRSQAEYAGNTGAQDSWFSCDAGERQTEGPGNYYDDSRSIFVYTHAVHAMCGPDAMIEL